MHKVYAPLIRNWKGFLSLGESWPNQDKAKISSFSNSFGRSFLIAYLISLKI